MAQGRFISYLRVSTAGQGRSGLGVEAQRQAVETYLNGGKWKLVKEFVEIESGKRSDNRPELAKALALCRAHRAALHVPVDRDQQVTGLAFRRFGEEQETAVRPPELKVLFEDASQLMAMAGDLGRALFGGNFRDEDFWVGRQ